MMQWLRFVLCICTVGLAAGCATRPAAPQGFTFALMGDQQYDEREEMLFPLMLEAIDATDVAFVVHVGDFKAGSNAPCTDELYERRRGEFDQSRHAFIFTPGDNDWIDCRRPTNGRADPLERLQKLREVFFRDPRSLGQRAIPLLRQSSVFPDDPLLARYSENAMWTHAGVVFATFNISGSNDNVGFDPTNDREQSERTHANVVWLQRVMTDSAKDGVLAVAIFLQANPGFEETTASVARSGYAAFLKAFEKAARSLGKPVLFAHGDTHLFRVDQPYLSPLDKRPIANVLRVETVGSPFTDWVRITFDPLNRMQPFIVTRGGFLPLSSAD